MRTMQIVWKQSSIKSVQIGCIVKVTLRKSRFFGDSLADEHVALGVRFCQNLIQCVTLSNQ